MVFLGTHHEHNFVLYSFWQNMTGTIKTNIRFYSDVTITQWQKSTSLLSTGHRHNILEVQNVLYLCSRYLTVDEPLSYCGHIYHPCKQCLVTLFTLDTNSIFPSQPVMMINVSHMADISLWVVICLSSCLGICSIYWLLQEDWLFKHWCYCHSTKWTAPFHYDNTVGQMHFFLPFAFFFFFLLHSSEDSFKYSSLLCHLHQNVLVGGKTIKKDTVTI